jgi:uncharacterized protein (TIGR00255 family)
MTGFARVEGAQADWSWAVEARSVNGRNLETRYRGPPGFDALERVSREGAQARMGRGQVNVAVTAKRTLAGGGVRVNAETLERYLSLGAGLIAEGRATPPSVDGLLALRGVLEADEGEPDTDARAALEAVLGGAIGQALDGLKASRLQEGAALTPVLGGVLDRIEALVAEAEREAAGQPDALRTRFAERMAELVGKGAVAEERIVQEAALLAGKADVREELDRLASHVDSARALLAAEGPVGRKFDFLTQEFMRETNTLCAKSASIPLTRIGLDLKTAIEQLREQVQNVE